MRKLLPVLMFVCSAAIAQNTVNVTTSQYETLKQNHLLDATKHYNFTDVSSVFKDKLKPTNKIISSRAPSTICSCMIPLDTTFTVAMSRNDDGSTGLITLPFSFNFYGMSYSSVYINNNGNISFSSAYYTFTANPFPDSSYNMIAPFWADVDTRDTLSGLVYYKITPTSLIVKWDNVGYYPSMSDKLNTFQLIITDGADPILPGGNNVAFCYGDMQWTTGSASSGVGGFGGVPATVGVNAGDGTNYFQVGRFDTTGVAFDGPYGNTDQVDWLDNQGMYFNTSILGNIPPIIINNNICDTIDAVTGDTTHSMMTFVDSVMFRIGVSTPEIDQTVTATLNSSLPSHFSYTMTMNTPTYKEYSCKFITKGTAVGVYSVTVNASDSGTPEGLSSKTIYIRTVYDATAGISENTATAGISIYPNPADESITVKHNFNAAANPVLYVTNVMGQNVMIAQLNNQQQTVDISGLSKGIYFATITNKDGKSNTIKIVKK